MIKFTKDLCVGVGAFDAEHLQLGALANLLYDAIRTGEAGNSLDNILTNLIDHTTRHFAHEETEMRRTRYSGFSRHAKEHRALKASINLFKAKTELRQVDPSDVAQEVADFTSTWLMDHIVTMDREFARFLERSAGRR